MVGLNLLAEARSVGLTVEIDGDRLIIRGPKSAAETAERLLRHKAEVIAAIAEESRSDAKPAFEWDWFDFISDEDRRYLLGPRNYPPPCPWCGGRFLHSTLCVELHAAWAIKMPLKKYKGRPISDVPTDYLNWARKNVLSLSTEVKEEIDRVLKSRKGVVWTANDKRVSATADRSLDHGADAQSGQRRPPVSNPKDTTAISQGSTETQKTAGVEITLDQSENSKRFLVTI